MKARLKHYWGDLRASFWFVPGAMLLAGAVLAIVVVTLDQAVSRGVVLPGWVYAGGADGARTLLSTVAGSIVTVAGLGFSITIVVLALASNQFGPRVLTLFMRDVTNQVTLGIFTGTFAYCILVLRTIRGPDEGDFVPEIAVTMAIGLTLVSVGALISFFHHVAVSIQAPKVVAAVWRDLESAIDRVYPHDIGEAGARPAGGGLPDASSDVVVRSDASGYVQAVDGASLIDTARRHDIVVRLQTRPGLFVVAGAPIAVAGPRERVDDATLDRIRSALILGEVRTAEDDVEFAVRQLVELALRALSPSINDPFTALSVIDWLGAALARLGSTEFPSRYRYVDGRIGVVANVSTFGGIAHTAFSRIRHYGSTHPVVLNRLLESIATIAPQIAAEADRTVVREEADAVLEAGRRNLTTAADVQELERQYAATIEALARAAGPLGG